MDNIIMVDGRAVDASKGFVVERRGKSEQFATIEEARAEIRANGGTIHYWLA